MKILHILSQMPDFTGSGKTIQAIMEQAGTRGHENFMIAGIQDGFKPEPSLIRPDHTFFVRFDGVDLDFPLPGMSDVMPYRSTVFSSMGPGRLKKYEAAFEAVMQRVRQRVNPDIIHSHHLWIVSKIARKVFPDRPMVTTCHGTCLRQFYLCPEPGSQVGRAVRKIDGIMCLSHHQKDQIQAIHSIDPEKLHVVGGGFDKALFFSAPKSVKGPVEIVYAGKLSRAKGVLSLLRSLKKMPTLNFRLHVAGAGSGLEEQECLSLAESLGDRVLVHGPLPHHDLARLMRKAHLFVLPSFFEGLPLVLMEALSSGCRILSTALPGTQEILGDRPSDMVTLVDLPVLETVDKPFEKDLPLLEQALSLALEKSIKKILQKRQPDMALVREITKAYTWEKVFARMETVYEKVCQKKMFTTPLQKP